MENNKHSLPIVDTQTNKPINLQKILPKREWWTVWHFIFTGKPAKVTKEKN